MIPPGKMNIWIPNMPKLMSVEIWVWVRPITNQNLIHAWRELLTPQIARVL